jgi:hypothetical protein
MASYTPEQFQQKMDLNKSQFTERLNAQQANRPWAQKNPGYAAMGAGAAGGLGGILSGLLGGGGLFGKGESQQQVPMFSPEIMGLKNQMAPNIWQQLMGDQFDFAPIENQARQGFQSKTVPGLMNRFNMGDNRSSSAQFGALGSAGAGLDSQLASMRQHYGLQRQNLLSTLMGHSMSPSFETNMRPRQAGGMEQGIGAIMQLLPLLMAVM